MRKLVSRSTWRKQVLGTLFVLVFVWAAQEAVAAAPIFRFLYEVSGGFPPHGSASFSSRTAESNSVPKTGDEDFENHIVKYYDNKATQTLYSSWTAEYQNMNGADFPAIRRLMDIFNELELVNSHDPLIIGGTNEGQLSETALNINPRVLFYGFEIQPDVYMRVKAKLSYFPQAKVLNLGMSDKELSNVPISGDGGEAGMFDPHGQRGGRWKVSREGENRPQ